MDVAIGLCGDNFGDCRSLSVRGRVAGGWLVRGGGGEVWMDGCEGIWRSCSCYFCAWLKVRSLEIKLDRQIVILLIRCS